MGELKCFTAKITIRCVRAFYSLWYDSKYLRGRLFDTEHFTRGWRELPKIWFTQKILGWNRKVPWPCYPGILFGDYRNIEFNLDDMDNFFNSGNYYQGIDAKIRIGKGTAIGPGVGIITANHNIYNLSRSERGLDVTIGDCCWIGMNAVLLPGIVLGAHTIVGAGAVVTKSFPEGECIIAGNPAHVIKILSNGGE